MLIGEQIGRYEIRGKIGAGGMGEVYLAHDATLNRMVALKILSRDFSGDQIRLQRFKQEARAASALNHPNILTVYEIGEAEEGYFIATEFIEGETLREHLKDSPLRVTQAVRIAEQIAQALVAAHDAGIIHRDIKPENVMIRRDGYVKILDFGLAKPNRTKQSVESENTTAQIINTTPGLVMGSVRYMSPEQARGIAVDGRTDVWSLGVVLYEMLTGRAPFKGATTSDTIAALIYLEPEPLARLAPNAPAELNRVVRKALQKERDERYQSVKDLALDLKNLLYDLEREISLENNFRQTNSTGDINENPTMIHRTSNAGYPAGVPAVSTSISSAEYIVNQVKKHKWQTLVVVLGSVVLAALGFANYFLRGEKREMAAAFEKTQVSRLSSDGKVRLPAMSPDGAYVAYLSGETGSRSLVVRQIATDSVITLVPASPLEIKTINFSPDGNYILYTQLSKDNVWGTLFQIPTLGGAPKKLAEDVDSEASFSPDGKRFAFLRHSSSEGGDLIFVADSDGSELRQLISTRHTDFDFFTFPAWSPDGAKLLVGTGKKQGANNYATAVAEISTADGGFKILDGGKWFSIGTLRWLKDGTGFLALARETESSPTQIWRVAYPSGEAHQITNDLNNYSGLSVSAAGDKLITIKGESVASLWRFFPATKELKQLTAESARRDGESGVLQTADGKIIFTRRSDKEINFWEIDAEGKNERQLTADAGLNFFPILTPVNRYIVFVSNRSRTQRIWRMDLDGKNPVRLTAESQNDWDSNPQVTADGKTIVFQRNNINNESVLMKISIHGEDETVLYSQTNIGISMPRLSQDGRRVAFTTFDMRIYEAKLHVAEFDGNSVGRIERSFDYDFTSSFLWSPDSKSLTYLSKEGIPNLWQMPLDGGKPRPLTEFKSGNVQFYYNWSADGKGLVISRAIHNNDLILISQK